MPLDQNLKYMYWVAHKTMSPTQCNDDVLLNNRIQTKGNNIFKEQSELNNMRNDDFICPFCFDSEIHKSIKCLKSTK